MNLYFERKFPSYVKYDYVNDIELHNIRDRIHGSTNFSTDIKFPKFG